MSLQLAPAATQTARPGVGVVSASGPPTGPGGTHALYAPSKVPFQTVKRTSGSVKASKATTVPSGHAGQWLHRFDFLRGTPFPP